MARDAAIVWFRSDLRVEDNPALHAACERGGAVVPVFVWAPEEEGEWAPGGASKVWLHDSLETLGEALRSLGSRLIIRRGPSGEALGKLAKEVGAKAVFWNRRYEPVVLARDEQLRGELEGAGLEVRTFNSALLFEPWDIANQQGKPFQVFTPFWKACQQREACRRPLPRPGKIRGVRPWPESLDLGALELEPRIDWAGGIREAWRPGGEGAREQLARFLDETVGGYEGSRERPAETGTSRLSPHLHFGEIGPRQVWHAVQDRGAADTRCGNGAEAFLRELGWREFSHHLLHHFPHTPREPLRERFAKLPWREDIDNLRAWQKGMTGYPIVDAGMRELWATGWMHNRVRMIVASFLTKDLLIPWQEGARWFWDTLVDADLANNTQGWQWTAGCGADAAPYFRVFNPVTQGERYDADGAYVRRWVPELCEVPVKWIHKPWEAPGAVLAEAGVTVGEDYPGPIVDHAEARGRALGAYEVVKRG